MKILYNQGIMHLIEKKAGIYENFGRSSFVFNRYK